MKGYRALLGRLAQKTKVLGINEEENCGFEVKKTVNLVEEGLWSVGLLLRNLAIVEQSVNFYAELFRAERSEIIQFFYHLLILDNILNYCKP